MCMKCMNGFMAYCVPEDHKQTTLLMAGKNPSKNIYIYISSEQNVNSRMIV